MTTAEALSVKVPDIGDFDDVPIIEILVSVGDSVAAEDPLVTLESDKATMDVPAPSPGTVKEIQVKVGDRVSQGAVLMTLEPAPEGGADAVEATSAPLSGAEAAEEQDAPETPAPPEEPEETGNGGGPEFGRQAELARPDEVRPCHAAIAASSLWTPRSVTAPR